MIAWKVGCEFGLEQGRIEGRAAEWTMNWLKLFGVVVAGSTIGCAITLAAAFAISFV